MRFETFEAMAKPPEETGNGIVDWLNNQDIANDPELREALGADNLFFEERLRIGDADVLLRGRPESDGRHVSSRSTRGATHDLRFRLARNLPREQAIAQAVGYAESKSGPHFRELTDKERRICERLCVRDRNAAFVFYIQARLPEYLANEFLELGSAGDELGIQKFGADERISEIAEEAVANCFFWSQPRATESFFDLVRANDGGRTWTFALLDSLWHQHQTGSAIRHLSPDQPTADEVVTAAENMSDEELEKTLTEARRLRSRSRY